MNIPDINIIMEFINTVGINLLIVSFFLSMLIIGLPFLFLIMVMLFKDPPSLSNEVLKRLYNGKKVARTFLRLKFIGISDADFNTAIKKLEDSKKIKQTIKDELGKNIPAYIITDKGKEALDIINGKNKMQA